MYGLSTVQAMEFHVLSCFVYSVKRCPQFLRINGITTYRYHCTVTSFPAKDDEANLSLEDLSALLRSANEMIQSMNRPQLLFASNFTIQGIPHHCKINYLTCCNTIYPQMSLNQW